jgi:mRNA interferase MazF
MVVLNNDVLNHHSNLALVCPITDIIKNHPIYIKLDDRTANPQLYRLNTL